MAVDSARIAVADPAAPGVHVFDLAHGRHRLLRGTDRRRFVQPIGIALDGDDVWVSDAEAGTVFRMSEDGREAARIEAPLVRPAGIAVRPDLGLVYVVDVHAHEVRVFDRDGRARFSFGGRGSDVGSFNFPTNIAIDGDGRVYVTDSMNFRVQIFTAEGEYLRSFGRAGDREGDLPRPKGIGVDSRGHVYVVEGLYDAINVFDRDGRHLLTFGGPGTRAGEFWLATGLAVDDHDRVWIADSFNGRLQVFRYLEED